MGLKYLIKEAKYYKKVDGSLGRIFKKFLFAKSPLKRMVNTPIYNKIYLKRLKKIANSLKPYILSIENTNMCNARCIMCPHTKMKRRKKIMNQENFEKIIRNVMANEKNIKFATITGFGEPLIDKDINKKIKFLNDFYPEKKVIVFTNASLLTKEMSEKLLKVNVFKINFSINGTEEKYKKIMGLDYENTIKNIKYFLERKKQLKMEFPLINISLMLLDDNLSDVKKFTNYWGDKVDSVMTYYPSDWAGGIDKIGTGIAKIPFKNKRWPCSTLWRFVAIDVEGNVVMCHRDYESKFKLGNLLKNPYKKIKQKIENLKQKQLNFDFSSPICNNCDNSFDSSLDWWEN
jgi:radical SAM protein with 4Fe4S-binding SPASM domain